MTKEYKLNVETPKSFSFVKRDIPEVTIEQREEALKKLTIMNLLFQLGC